MSDKADFEYEDLMGATDTAIMTDDGEMLSFEDFAEDDGNEKENTSGKDKTDESLSKSDDEESSETSQETDGDESESETDDESDDDDNRKDGKDSIDDKKVPLAALREAREENKQLKASYSQLQSQIEELASIIKQNNKSAGPKEEEEEIDIGKDPLVFLTKKLETVSKLQAELEQQKQEKIRQEQQKQYQAQVLDEWSKSVNQVRNEVPDVEDATKYLIQTRAGQLSAFGMTSQQIESQLESEFMQLVAISHQRGENPALTALKMAKASGYNAKPPSVEKAVQKIKNTEKAKAATRSLTSTPSAPSHDKMTSEVLLSMSEEEFGKWMRSNPKEYEEIMREML